MINHPSGGPGKVTKECDCTSIPFYPSNYDPINILCHGFPTLHSLGCDA